MPVAPLLRQYVATLPLLDLYYPADILTRVVIRYQEEGGSCETDKSRPFRWEFSHCNQQESGWQCGYYVIYFMFHFASYQQSNFSKRVPWNDQTPLTKRMLDDIVKTWATRFSSVYLKHLVN
ncbi:hypothetical protein L6452_22406 [Arctium lappa]|uniref:Uncharacterized protein n=1 Tax=Arctium lappa TaxID=4217 RepID=A0ACB9AYW1_ARCLA|nr:hypothetical protein L6452_22406 [Arctium lappa]